MTRSETSPPRRALIVIDVQNEYTVGKLPIVWPPIASSLPQIGRAMDAAHEAGIAIVVVQNDAPAAFPVFAVGSATWALQDTVASRPRDHLISKTLPSAFAGTDLAGWLEARQIDTIAVVGYMTHNCDAATIFEAAHRGLEVEFLADASGSLAYSNEAGSASAEEIHRVFSVVFHSRFAAVCSTDHWIAALKTGDRLPKSYILVSHRGEATP